MLCNFQQHTNEPDGGPEVWMRNDSGLMFIRQQPHHADYYIHYRVEGKSLVISVATMICFYNELLTIIIVDCVRRRARKRDTSG